MQDVCLFAHFDKDDRVDDYVLRYLKILKELNFSIIFISTSRLHRTDIARLQAVCDDVMLRENTGLDFASWSAGFAKHASAIGGRLLLANDSVYGPIGSLGAALARLTSKPADFYGMVESIDVAPHLQSWFLLFEPWVVRHPTFKSILAQPFSAMSKRQIIENGEVVLSRLLVGAGFRYEALYLISREGLIARHYPINPTHLLWRELLLDAGVPFLKTELLRKNPLHLEKEDAILQLVQPMDESFCRLIRLHLARTADTGAPITPHKNAVNDWILKQRYAMLREGYRLSHEKRTALEIWNFVKFELFIVTLRVCRALYLLLRNRSNQL